MLNGSGSRWAMSDWLKEGLRLRDAIGSEPTFGGRVMGVHEPAWQHWDDRRQKFLSWCCSHANRLLALAEAAEELHSSEEGVKLRTPDQLMAWDTIGLLLRGEE